MIPRWWNRPLQTFRGTPQSLGCSPATPNHLGPKSLRVTNVNHKIDNMHKCSSGWIALFLNFTQPQFNLANLINHSLREGWESWQGSKTYVCVSAESAALAASKGGGLGVFIAPLEKLAVAHTGHVRYDLHCANGN